MTHPPTPALPRWRTTLQRSRAAWSRALDALELVAMHRALDVMAIPLVLGGLWYAWIFAGLYEQLSSPAFQWALAWAPGPASTRPLVWGAWFALSALSLGWSAYRHHVVAAVRALGLMGSAFIVVSVAHVVTGSLRPAPTGVAAYAVLMLYASFLAVLMGLAERHRRRRAAAEQAAAARRVTT